MFAKENSSVPNAAQRGVVLCTTGSHLHPRLTNAADTRLRDRRYLGFVRLLRLINYTNFHTYANPREPTAMSTRFAEAGPPTDFIRLISASLVGITCFLCLEIIVRLLLRCTRLSLYFWACLIDICAITLHVVLAILINLREMHPYIGILVLVECSWGIFVVGQSIVLYSRLDLVMKNKKLARYVLWTIIFTAVILGLPTVILEIVAVSRYLST